MIFDAGKIKEVTSFLESKNYSPDQISQALEFCSAYCDGQAKECEIKSQGGGGDENIDTGLLVAIIKEIGKASTNTVKMAQEIRGSIKSLESDKSDFQNDLFKTQQMANRAIGKSELKFEQASTELAEELHERLDLVESSMSGRVSPVPKEKTLQAEPASHLTEYEKTGSFNPNADYDPYRLFDVPLQTREESNRGQGEWESIGMPGA